MRLLLTAVMGLGVAAACQAQTTRGLVDTVGFARFPEQLERVIALSDSLERDSLAQRDRTIWSKLGEDWVTAISPHDDHVYAGRVYWHLFRHYRAPRAILVGVAHKAWRWGEANRLIFGSFDQWRGPWGPVKVWSLRDSVLRRLPNDAFTVSSRYQSEEHSLEAMIPWMQYRRRDVQILPFLVPYMHFGRMDSIASQLAHVLAVLIRREGLEWGKDFVILISSDAVHYGDQGWGGKNFAPFGADEAGYRRAVQREYRLLSSYVLGPISPERLNRLLYSLVDSTDLKKYRIPWCGRFSVPFGLLLTYHLSRELGRPTPAGYLLRYDTSWGLGRLPVTLRGLGVTAPRSLHHWVGYAAVVYF